MKRKLVIGAAALLAAGAAGATAAVASGDDGEGTVTGPQADRATAAALAETGGGTANAVERDSENGATWEVEVTTPPARPSTYGSTRTSRSWSSRATARADDADGCVPAIAAAPDVLPPVSRTCCVKCPECETLRLRDSTPSVAATPR